MPGPEPPRPDPRLVRELNREALRRAGTGRLTLVDRAEERGARRLGRSMLPGLGPGQDVTWSAPSRSVAVGDIVVFEQGDAAGAGAADAAPLAPVAPLAPLVTVVHRVVGILPDGRLVTKGDNRATRDPKPLEPGDVLGVVTEAHGTSGTVELRGRGGRLHARVAAWISAAGDATFRLAAALDGLGGRAFPGLDDADWSARACARRIAWSGQRALQRAWHGASYRACHRASRRGR